MILLVYLTMLYPFKYEFVIYSMKDVRNDTDLGLQYNWDNDPCRKIVDQKYRVEVRDEKGLEGMDTSLRERAKKLVSLGFEIDASVQLVAQREYTSPLSCFNFVNQVENSGFVLGIEERRFSATDEPYWQSIFKEDLEKILKEERVPAYRLREPYNPNFAPCVDIGD